MKGIDQLVAVERQKYIFLRKMGIQNLLSGWVTLLVVMMLSPSPVCVDKYISKLGNLF